MMDVFTAGSTWAADRDALLTLPRRHVVLLAADWAEDVLHVYESACPGDDRPRRAVEAARWGGGRSAYAAANAVNAAYAAVNAVNAAYAAADAAYAAVNAAYAAANAAAGAAYAAANAAANAAARAAYAAVNAAYAVGGRRRVHARWRAAWHGGRAFDPSWRTPLGRQLAADPEAYPVLLDHLSDLGAEVDDLRGLAWARSNWAVFHATEADVLSNRLPEEVCDGTA
jgi:hypothetical protein